MTHKQIPGTAHSPLCRTSFERRRRRLGPSALSLALAIPLLLATPVAAASPPPASPSPPPAGASSAAQAPGLVIDLPAPDATPLPDDVAMPAGARLAYVVGAESDRPRIRVIAADGSGGSAVSAGTAPDWLLPPFASGDVLALECHRRAAAPDGICLEELDSYWDTTLLEDATQPRWSPWGDAMAFSRSNGDAGEAWVADLSDFHPRSSEETVGPIARLPGRDPRWSPAGDRLLITDDRGGEPVLTGVGPDGTELRRVGEGRHGTWSPDGRRVAFAAWDGTRTTIAATSILTGASEVPASVAGPLAALRWLPGDGLVVLTDRDGTGTGDLYLIELSDGSVRSLTSGLSVEPDLSVSPDGAWIAFAADRGPGRDIYVASRRGGWRRVTTTADAAMPAWGAFRPMFERGAYIQPRVDRLRVRSHPWVGDESLRYEPLLSQGVVLEVQEGPVAGSGYWWYRVRLAGWEDLRLRDGSRGGIRSGWVAAADHDGSAWIGRVDVDPGPRRPQLHFGWPAASRGEVSLAADAPTIGAEGSLVLDATIDGRHPGTALTLVAEGDAQIVWRCGTSTADASQGGADATARVASSARDWADISAASDGTGSTTLTLLPPPAPVDLCPPDAPGTPVAAEVRWHGVRVQDPLHRLELRPEAVSNEIEG